MHAQTFFPEEKKLFGNLSYSSCANGMTAFPDGKPQSLLHSNRRMKLYGYLHIVTGHNHLNPLRKLNRSGHIRCPEVKLRAISREERSVRSEEHTSEL